VNPRVNPYVSIGVPVYNGEEFLEEALESLLAQTFRDLEIIISDNASTDRTEELCRRFVQRDPRVRYVRNAVNVGAGRNYNAVFALARGTYFKWAAHDDVCEPAFIERCVEVLDREPRIVLSFPQMVDIDEHGRVIDRPYVSTLRRGDRGAFPQSHQRFRFLIRLGYTCEEVFGVIRSDVLRKTRLIQNYTDSDRTLLAELALHGPFREVPEVLFRHRVHRGMSTQAFSDWNARVAWFDPALAGKRTFPLWRQFREYLGAIHRGPVSVGDKVRCGLYMMNWCRRHRNHLLGELSGGIAGMFRAPAPPEPPGKLRHDH